MSQASLTHCCGLSKVVLLAHTKRVWVLQLHDQGWVGCPVTSEKC
jgi:hypothetical protein